LFVANASHCLKNIKRADDIYCRCFVFLFLQKDREGLKNIKGRRVDGSSCLARPSQNRTCGFPAYGS
jgi:hypothetical protein